MFLLLRFAHLFLLSFIHPSVRSCTLFNRVIFSIESFSLYFSQLTSHRVAFYPLLWIISNHCSKPNFSQPRLFNGYSVKRPASLHGARIWQSKHPYDSWSLGWWTCFATVSWAYLMNLVHCTPQRTAVTHQFLLGMWEESAGIFVASIFGYTIKTDN